MADITMCKGDNCPSKQTCYRFLATPSEYRQSYFYPTPTTQSTSLLTARRLTLSSYRPMTKR